MLGPVLVGQATFTGVVRSLAPAPPPACGIIPAFIGRRWKRNSDTNYFVAGGGDIICGDRCHEGK